MAKCDKRTNPNCFGKRTVNNHTRRHSILKLSQLDDAIADYEAALKLNPKFAAALYGRGLAKQMKGSDGDADIAAARAIRPDIAERFAGYGAK
jgi:tetratricopeptide (TPR) repeat protein